MRHDTTSPLQRSKTSLSQSVSGLKVLEPNELYFNYLQETDIILRLFSAHYIHKSSNLLHTAVKKIIITIFDQFCDPHNPITFLPPNPLCSFVPPLSSLPPRRHNTHTSTQSHTHTHVCTQEQVQIDMNTHTFLSGLYSGLSVWHRALWLCIFSVLQSEGGDKGPADYSKARHHSSYMWKEWCGVEGVMMTVGEGLYSNLLCFKPL